MDQAPVSEPPVPDDATVRRKVIHVDMDAFYASVEQRDDPTLRGRPVAVGGSRERGVVAAASYEARTYGVRSAMASVTARRRCPDLVFVKPRFEVYRAVSAQIREVFARYTDLVEPLSLDEAYLDVTENKEGVATATEVARRIKEEIRDVTGLTASAGVSYNKFLAKLASDHRKPDGLFVITPSRGPGFVLDLPVARFHGIGPATAARMNALGILTGRDLGARTPDELRRAFGKAGDHFHAIAHGRDDRPVRPDRVRKSVGAETTFDSDLHDVADLLGKLGPCVDKVWDWCEKGDVTGRTVTVKLKFSDFRQSTRSRTLRADVAARGDLHAQAAAILAECCPLPMPVRLVGVSLSSLTTDRGDEAETCQLSLTL